METSHRSEDDGYRVDLIWMDPPPTNMTGRSMTGRNAAYLRELQSRPGEWALVNAGHDTWNHPLRASLARSGCDTATRTVVGANDVRTYDTYARWPEEAQS